MRFFAGSGSVPDIHHLVKFYLDHLRGEVFTDDSQVASLIAISWKPPPGFGGFDDLSGNQVVIEVERFADCMRRFDLWQALCDDHRFRGIAKDDEDDRLYSHRDDVPHDRSFESVKMPEAARQAWRRLQLIHFQKDLLAGNRIDCWDRPGGAPAPLAKVGSLWKRQAHPLLFTLDLGGLPTRGGSDAFKKHVREQMRTIAEKWGDPSRFIVPLELDVQVPEERGSTATDLDNVIRRYIAPAVANELLKPPDGYLAGYRIYRVRTSTRDGRTVSVKILGKGALQRFVERMDRTLDVGRKWVRDSLR
jgi:hypothetical protein